jgi:polyisoprenoid-binding protein YceI
MRLLTRVAFAVLALSTAAFAADTYKIDASHSNVGFKVRHLLSKTSGRFTKFEGTITIDAQDIKKSSVDVSIDAASVNTDNDARDKHLRGGDFFEVEKFPKITFKSSSVKEVEKGKLEVTGDFTMHGVTKKITFPITNAGTRPGMRPGSVVGGFIDGALKLKRSEFGMSYGITQGVLGDDVEISIDVEAMKAEAMKEEPKK